MEGERPQSTHEVAQLCAKVEEQQRLLAEMEEQVTLLEATIQQQQRILDVIYASLGWRLVSLVWDLTDRFLPLGSRQRALAGIIYNLPGFFVPRELVRIVKQIRMFGLKAASREVRHRLRAGGQAYSDGAIQIVPVASPATVAMADACPTASVTISVAIPVKNAGDDFRLLLTMLRKQRGFEKIEIVVVDSGSTDQSLAIATECGAKLLQIPPESFSHSSARNLAAEHASGDYLLFMVQDALPPSEQWLHELFRVTQSNDVVAVSCAEFPREDADLFYRALMWNHGKFLEIDKQDRILCQPQQPNHLSLRKNANLSDIACLIRRDVFLNYGFRGSYAEDLDLGLRLIRDGYRLALLGSTRVIHSHNRPAYYHLKRGYVDNLAISNLLPDRPMLAMNVTQRIRDIVFVYAVMQELVLHTLAHLTLPCSFKRLVSVVIGQFHKAARQPYPSSLVFTTNAYLEEQCVTFLSDLYQQHYVPQATRVPYDGVLLDAVRYFASSVLFAHMDEVYTRVDETLLEECKLSLYKAYAFTCGMHLAESFYTGSTTTRSLLSEMHETLTRGV